MDSKNVEIPAAPAEPLIKQPETKPFENTKYEIDGHKIDVYSKAFSPTGTENPKPDNATILIPGWTSGPGRNFEILGQAYADEGGKKSYVANSFEFSHIRPDRLATEAKALAQFIEAKGLKNVTIVGNSEGGAKAILLVNVLQQEFPDIAIDGLVLITPTGLYKQSTMALFKRFREESVRFNAKTDIKETPEQFRQTYEQRFANNNSVGFKDKEINQMRGPNWKTDILAARTGIKDLQWAKGLNYLFTKLIPQVSDMAKDQSAAMQKIKCPVVLVQGRYDTVSDPKKVVGEAGMDDYKERIRILKENFFPNSPDVSMMLPKRVGSHGLIHFRQEELAKISMYLLERVKRRNRPPEAKTPLPIPESPFETITTSPDND